MEGEAEDTAATSALTSSSHKFSKPIKGLQVSGTREKNELHQETG